MIKIDLKNLETFEEPFKHLVYKDCIVGDQRSIRDQALELARKAKDQLVENTNFSKIELKNASAACGELLKFMASKELAEICAKHFSIPDLEADPFYDGGGLTVTGVGKHLRYHFDFPYSNIAKKYRVVNALLYLSDPDIVGGELHLIDPETGTVEARVEPKFGTLAIFATSNGSPHGVSKIYKHPRISINSYFYAEKPLDDRVKPTKTVWLNYTEGMKH